MRHIFPRMELRCKVRLQCSLGAQHRQVVMGEAEVVVAHATDRPVAPRTLRAGDLTLATLGERERLEAAARLGGLKATLRPHQQAALAWMVQREHRQWIGNLPGAGAHLFDQMGLGKTVEVLSLICFARSLIARRSLPFPPWGAQLIVVPNAVLDNWRMEILRFTDIRPSQIGVYHGARRAAVLRDVGDKHVVLTTYGTLQADAYPTARAIRARRGRHASTADAGALDRTAPLFRVRWGRVILDEAHTSRNRKSKLSRALQCLRSKLSEPPRTVANDEESDGSSGEDDVSSDASVGEGSSPCVYGRVPLWCLTGTPVTNEVDDLCSLNLLIDLPPSTYGSTKWLDAHKDDEGPMRTFRSEYMLMRGKSVMNLPPIRRVRYAVPLDRREYRVYATVSGDVDAAFKNFQARTGRERFAAFSQILRALTRLRQAVTHAGLLAGADRVRAHFDGRVRIRALLEPSSKLRFALAILRRFPEERFLVFSQWTSMLAVTKFHLEVLGIPCLVYSGEMTMKARDAVLTRWRLRARPRVLLISTKAGGIGLNLTEATHVIFLDWWYTPASHAQAEDRTHRIGQTSPVTVHSLVSVVPIAPIPGLRADDARDGGRAARYVQQAERTIDHCVLALHRDKLELSVLLVRGIGALLKARADEGGEGIGEREVISMVGRLRSHTGARDAMVALRATGQRRLAEDEAA